MAEYNKTHLDVEFGEKKQLIHRDLIAHSFRWSHVAREINKLGGECVLDLGCADAPLAMMLWANRFRPSLYVGVDIRPLMIERAKEKMTMAQFPKEFIVADLCKEFEKIPKHPYTLITSFEFVEHIPGEQVEPFLVNVKGLMGPETRFFLSTPCFDGKNQAANHVKEWYYQELRDLLEKHFVVDGVFGTFMNQRDFKAVATPERLELFEKLHAYYDANVLATFFAPLYPEKARNCIWRLKLKS